MGCAWHTGQWMVPALPQSLPHCLCKVPFPDAWEQVQSGAGWESISVCWEGLGPSLLGHEGGQLPRDPLACPSGAMLASEARALAQLPPAASRVLALRVEATVHGDAQRRDR